MPPPVRTFILMLVAAVAPGCTHFANVTEVPTTDGTAVYVSSRAWDDGTPRTIVTERVFERPTAPCDVLEIEREFYDETGALLVRETDVETCRVVLVRTTEEYDMGSAQVRRTRQRDANRDGVFDVERVAYEPLNERPDAPALASVDSR